MDWGAPDYNDNKRRLVGGQGEWRGSPRMDNRMLRYTVALYLKGDELAPERITAAFGMDPSRAHKKGHKPVTASGAQAGKLTGLWSLEVESPDLSGAIVDLHSKVGNVSERIRSLPEVEWAYVDVYVNVLADDRGGGAVAFELDPACASAMAAFGIPLNFTIDVVPE